MNPDNADIIYPKISLRHTQDREVDAFGGIIAYSL
jgi:hypothetical protein